jgi:hypothetical protein
MTEIVSAEEVLEMIQDPLSKLTNDRQISFLQEIVMTGGNIRKSAERAGISTRSHYDWLSQDDYRSAFDAAYQRSTRMLEAEAIRRATGFERPLVYKGQVTGSITEHSDNLLMFLLKQRDPSYRDNNSQQVGIWGQDGKINVMFNIPRPPRSGEDDKRVTIGEPG